MHWALSFCVKQGWQNVIIESDCKCLVEALQGRSKRCYHINTIVDNCRSLSHNFSSLPFLFCFRDCNGVAHRLANWAMSSCCDKVWVDDIPPWLGDALYSNSLI